MLTQSERTQLEKDAAALLAEKQSSTDFPVNKFLKLSHLYFQLGNMLEAWRYVHEAEFKDKDHPGVHYFKAQYYYQDNKLDEAFVSILVCIERHHDKQEKRGMPYAWRGKILHAQGKLEAAEKSFDDAIRMAPDDESVKKLIRGVREKIVLSEQGQGTLVVHAHPGASPDVVGIAGNLPAGASSVLNVTVIAHQVTHGITHYQVPKANSNFVGRKPELEKIATFLRDGGVGVIQSKKDASNAQGAVYGMGGVGKSSLASAVVDSVMKDQLIGDIKLDYDYVAWLDGNDIQSAFVGLALQLGIDVSAKEFVENPLLLVQQVYTTLLKKHQRLLLVFDDAKDFEAIEKHMPPEVRSPHKVNVLITSRSTAWTGLDTIELGVFSDDEAFDFIRQYLSEVTREEALSLAKMLHNFPLALSQAVSYIKNQAQLIGDYQELYGRQQKLLLDSKGIARDKYQYTVYTTWYLSVEKLRESVPQAEDVLNFCAFLASNNILQNLVKKALVIGEEWLSVIESLHAHSLIHLESNDTLFSMHRLLQEVVRLHLQESALNPQRFNGADFDSAVLDDKALMLKEMLLPKERQIELARLVVRSVFDEDISEKVELRKVQIATAPLPPSLTAYDY